MDGTSAVDAALENAPRRHDQYRPGNLGILVADVSGQGVPAALISSMIKVAMQSVSVHAHDPAQVLGGLNRILWSVAHGQLASATYVWIDTEKSQVAPLGCWPSAAVNLLPKYDARKCSVSNLMGCCSESKLTRSA